MKRYSDVLALIQESTDQYNEVKALYDGALRDKSLDIRIKVKNLMENLRSILDLPMIYMKIYANLIGGN